MSALRETGAGLEPSVGTVLDIHRSATLLAQLARLLIPYLNFLNLSLGLINSNLEIGIEVLYYSLPLNSALFNSVKQCLHRSGEINVHNLREGLLHNVIYDFANLCNEDILAFLNNISSAQNCCNCCSIG